MKSSREQFEEWFPQMVEGMPENMVKVFDEMLFTAWQASRSAIEIELPSVIWDMSEDGSQHYDRDEMINAIQSVGIKVKS